jgi:hypothetical protein
LQEERQQRGLVLNSLAHLPQQRRVLLVHLVEQVRLQQLVQVLLLLADTMRRRQPLRRPPTPPGRSERQARTRTAMTFLLVSTAATTS